MCVNKQFFSKILHFDVIRKAGLYKLKPDSFSKTIGGSIVQEKKEEGINPVKYWFEYINDKEMSLAKWRRVLSEFL